MIPETSEVTGAEHLAVAYEDMSRRLGPEVAVSQQIPAGVEIALGMVDDPQFGPVVLVSAGGTLIEMALACKARGANDVYACVSHGVFSRGSAEKVRSSPIKELVLTDTIGRWPEPLPPNCRRISVSRLFAEAILSIHRRESVSRLFDSEVEPELVEECDDREEPPPDDRPPSGPR